MNLDFKVLVNSEWFRRGQLLSKRTAVFNPNFYIPEYPEFVPDETIYNDYIEGSRITQQSTETIGDYSLTTYQGMFGGSGCDMFSGPTGEIGGPGRGAANNVGEVVSSYVDYSLQKYVIDTPQIVLNVIDLLKDYCAKNWVKSNYEARYDLVSPYNIGNILIHKGEKSLDGALIYYSNTNIPTSGLGIAGQFWIYNNDYNSSIFQQVILAAESGMVKYTGIEKFRMSKDTEITIIPNDYISAPAYQCLINNGKEMAKPTYDYCSVAPPLTLKITDSDLDTPYYIENNGETYLRFPFYTIQPEHCNIIGKLLLNHYDSNKALVEIPYTDVINPGLEQYTPDSYPSSMGDYYSFFIKNNAYTYPDLPMIPDTVYDMYNWKTLKDSGNIRNNALGIYKIKNENSYINQPRCTYLIVNYVHNDSLYCEKWKYTGETKVFINFYINEYLATKITYIDYATQEQLYITPTQAAGILASYDTVLLDYLKNISHETQTFAKIDLTRYKSYQDDKMYTKLSTSFESPFYGTIVDGNFAKIENGFVYFERAYSDNEFHFADSTYLTINSWNKFNIDIEDKCYVAVPSAGGSFYLEKFTSSVGSKIDATYALATTTAVVDGKTVITTQPIPIANGVKPEQNEPGYVPPALPEKPTIAAIEEFNQDSYSDGKGTEAEVELGFVLPKDAQVTLPTDHETGEEYIEADITVTVTDSLGAKHTITQKVYYTAPRGKANSKSSKFKLSDLIAGLNVSIIDIKVDASFTDPALAEAIQGVTIENKLTDTINPAEQAESIANPPFVKDSMTDKIVMSDSCYIQRTKAGTLRVSVTDSFEMSSTSNTIKTLSSMKSSTQSNSAVLSDSVLVIKTI